MFGIHNKIIRINLASREIVIEEPGEMFFRRYLGGRGIIAHTLVKELPADADPLSPQNVLVFAPSVVTGVKIPGTGRHSVGAKSPLTGLFGESESGGFWGPELKFAGYDAIIVKGAADGPVYIKIIDDAIEICDANHIWGNDTLDVHKSLREETGEAKLKTLIIGRAGEKMVRFAGIAHDVTHYHGRTGMGAVMGSKNLKAVVVRGTKKIEVADPDKLKELARFFAAHFKENADNKNQNNHGTSDYYFGAQAAGSLPTLNFGCGHFDDLDYDADALHAELKVKTEGCFACPVRCKQVFSSDKKGYEINEEYGGPEFETLAAFGSLCGVSDMYAAPKAHELCNKLGLDTVSTGATISFAMECYENGLISSEDTGGIDLRFGNAEAMLEMIEMIASRKGLGDILAEGTARAAEQIGNGAGRYAMHVKKQEFAMAEPRSKFGVGLAYAVSPTGADHLQHEHDGAFDSALTGYSHTADDPNVFLKSMYPMGWYDAVPSLSLSGEKVGLFVNLQHYWSLFNCLDLCIFTFEPVRTFKVNHLVDIVGAVTGWETSLHEMMKAGHRATTLARCFNIKHGLTVEDDLKVPDRLFEPLKKGPLDGTALDRKEFEEGVRLYYEMMGWDREEGKPLSATLYMLGIPWAI